MNLEKPIKNFMKKNPLLIDLDETLGGVASKMSAQKKDVAIVTDPEGEVRGLVTSHDLFDALRTYVLGKDTLEQVPKEVRELKVITIMKGTYTKEFMEACGLSGSNVCITLGENDSIVNAIRVMAITGIDHILISSEKGITGTLSDDDIIQVFME
ncbi:CBS domain-containing protein [Candidatus Bathyarchaeota archaeon]|nr:CBS domain-containing protein [Candidatus Bathyarchaeota archaeon]